MRSNIAPAIAFTWAGVVLGGSIIAAPAKFQAPSLTLPVALEVGRAQFLWIGIAEGALCFAFAAAAFLWRGVGWRLAVIPVILLLIQRLFVMPPLDARTVQVIAGEAVGDSALHVIFIALEGLKLVALIVAGAAGLASQPRRSAQP